MSQERLKQFIRAESRGKEKKTYCKQISKIHYAARQEQLIWYVPKSEMKSCNTKYSTFERCSKVIRNSNE